MLMCSQYTSKLWSNQSDQYAALQHAPPKHISNLRSGVGDIRNIQWHSQLHCCNVHICAAHSLCQPSVMVPQRSLADDSRRAMLSG